MVKKNLGATTWLCLCYNEVCFIKGLHCISTKPELCQSYHMITVVDARLDVLHIIIWTHCMLGNFACSSVICRSFLNHLFFLKNLRYEGWSKSSDRCLVILSRDIFERHTMHHSKDQVLTFIMMLLFSRCTVSINNHSTLYMVHSIPLAFFHIKE